MDLPDEACGGSVAHAGLAAYEEDGLVELVGGFELEDLFDEFGADAAADEGVAGALRHPYGEHDEADDHYGDDCRQEEGDDQVRHGVSVPLRGCGGEVGRLPLWGCRSPQVAGVTRGEVLRSPADLVVRSAGFRFGPGA